MARFSEEWLNELLSKVDIVNVISQYVSLTRKGNRFWACCPFHNEKTPSFAVTPEKQMYYCFSCHKGGGVIQFVMDYEKLGYIEAVTKLADMVGMELPTEQHSEGYNKQKEHRKRIIQLLKESALFYNKTLKTDCGRNAALYLKGRGIKREIVTRFGMGFAPNSYYALNEYLKTKGYTNSEMFDAGVVKQKDGHIYDSFRNRIMFPIINIFGDVIGFGGRVMDNSEPKYLNTGDTIVFNKRNNLYNLNYVKKLKELKYIILVEGYMDVISLNAAGVLPVVASLGTALTSSQAKLIKRYVNEVYISYDGDEPGIKAALRAIPILEAEGLHVKVVILQNGMDPDDFVKKFGGVEYISELSKAVASMEFRLIQKKRGFDLNSSEGIVKYATAAAEMIANMPNKIEQERYIKSLSKETGISEETILRQLGSDDNYQKMYNKGNNEINFHKANVCTEGSIISVLMDSPELIDKCEEILTEQDFSNKYFAEIFSYILAQRKKGILPTSAEILSRYIGKSDFPIDQIQCGEDTGLFSKSEYLDEMIISQKRESLIRKRDSMLREWASATDMNSKKLLLEKIDKINKYIYKDNER